MHRVVTMLGGTNYHPLDPGSHRAVDLGRLTRLSQGWVSIPISPIF